MTAPDAVAALAVALEAAIGHWEDAGAVSRFDSMDGARAIADALAAAGYPIVREEPEGAGLREALLATHVEHQVCGAVMNIEGTTCGYVERDALHDLHPDVAKRDRLPEGLREEQRHPFAPIGAGACDADMEDWPCIAARFARLPAPPPALDVERLADVLRYSPMHWEVRRPDGAFVMTRMFSSPEEAAAAIAAAYEREGS